jgi:geranylgeranyl diphosphate synthase, type II
MQNNIESYKDLIDKEINNLKIKQDPKNLYDPIRYLLAIGGKRMRPVLSLLSAELFGGNPKKAVHVGMAIELFHNFSLIHDDIMDKAPLRRGNVTVHEKWSDNIAIISGDALFAVAYQYLARTENKYLSDLLAVFSETVMEVCEGQQMDMDFEDRDDVTIAEYIEMIRLKTSVLLGAAMEMGAIVAEASIEDRKRIYCFGQHIGIAFQLQDDLLDLYADPDKFGKQVGGDIIANKKTFLLLKAQELASASQKEVLYGLISHTNHEEKINLTRQIFNEIGIPALAKAEMEKHYDIAMQSLAQLNVTEEYTQPLIALAQELMNREV